MAGYSHRDHRAYRSVYRLVGGVVAGTTALVALALVLPEPSWGVLAVLGLATLGGATLIASTRLVDTYARDLRSVDRGTEAPALLRVEVESRVELERSVFVGARPSPHARRPRQGSGDAPPGLQREPMA